MTCRADAAATRGKTMIACHYHTHGNPPLVGPVPVPLPPAAGELLIRVHAASINPADWKSALGEQKLLLTFDWPRVYGFDFSGVVAGVPAGETEFKVGDAVAGFIAGPPDRDHGTCAEFVRIDKTLCARKPASVTHMDAASVGLVGCTAIMMLEECLGKAAAPTGTCTTGTKAKPQPKVGPRVLVLGGAGGVGSVAIQLAKRMFGASFVATTASPGAKTDLVRQLGADAVVDYRRDDFAEVFRDEASLFDAVLVTTNAADAGRAPHVLRRGGHMCCVSGCDTVGAVRAWLANPVVNRKFAPGITTGVQTFLHSSWGGHAFDFFTGARGLRARCAARGASMSSVIGTGSGVIMAKLMSLMEEKSLCAVIDSSFPLARAAEAIARQRTGRAAGKVMVVCGDGGDTALPVGEEKRRRRSA